MSRFATAVRYLTIVPVPGAGPGSLHDVGRAAPWFSLVGIALGLALAATDRLTSVLFPPLLAALLTVTVWKLLTGGLHLDGLADCLDGLVGRDVEHRLLIMRDSRIGAFGAIGLILFLLLEIGAVAELPPPLGWRALVIAPAVGRAMPLLLARLFRPARPDGQGALFRAALGPSAPGVALGVAVIAAVLALGLAGLLATVVATAAALALGRFLAARLHGVTGDVLGASVEIGELAVLLTVSAWAHVRP